MNDPPSDATQWATMRQEMLESLRDELQNDLQSRVDQLEAEKSELKQRCDTLHHANSMILQRLFQGEEKISQLQEQVESLVWPLFSNAYGARVFATIVPLLNGIRLFVAGTGTEGGSGATSKNDENGQKTNNTSEGKTGIEVDLANAISRSGDAKEALQGPFVYVIVLLCCTFFFWVDTPIGVVAVATMAVGDGLADLIGRRFGASNKWPFSKSKSIAGSSAFVVGSVLGSFGLLSWLIWNGTMDPLPYDSLDLVGRLCVIAVICAGVELAPVVDDNYSVPIAAGILSAFLLN